jgi:glycosyltransferase involved in cell wall biosynthesis
VSTPVPRRLRIALVYDAVYPALHGGAERRYWELARHLARDHDVHLIGWRVPDDGTLPPGITIHGVGAAPPFYGADGRRTVREAAGFALRIVPHLVRHRYDVVDCCAVPFLPAYTCRAIARLTRTPTVVTWHEVWGSYWLRYLHDRPLVARIARVVEAGARRLGDRAVAVSAFTAERLETLGGGPPVDVVPNGVPIDAIEAAPEGRPVDVVFVGRLIADKRVDVLLRAISRVHVGRPVSCAIVGDGPELARLEALARELRLGAQVRFLGRLDEGAVFGQLKAASILAMPSVREGFGLTVVEGQAAGAIPIVARSPLSAAPDLVRDGIDGVVCDPTPDAFASTVEDLLARPDRISAMRQAAREAALALDWSRSAAAMDEVYRSLTGTPGRVTTAPRPIEADGGAGAT